MFKMTCFDTAAEAKDERAVPEGHANDAHPFDDQQRLSVFAPGASAPAEPDLPLCATTDDAPFFFELP